MLSGLLFMLAPMSSPTGAAACLATIGLLDIFNLAFMGIRLISERIDFPDLIKRVDDEVSKLTPATLPAG